MIWLALLVIFVAGGLGGIVNALMTDNGFPLPRSENKDGTSILRPGFLGNILIGGVGAMISWGLYGPASSLPLLPTAAARGEAGAADATPATPRLTLASFVGGILVGVGGARWLTNEVDKKLLRAAASQAALATSSNQLALTLAQAAPAEALHAASGAPSSQ